MKRLLVLGAGTAGTMVVNKLRPRLDPDEWQITVVDSDPDHHYQPGYLFIPFGTYEPDEVVKPKAGFIPTASSWSWARSTSSRPTTNGCCSPTGPGWTTTSS